MTTLHPSLEPVAFLLGTWRGEGAGRYPTIAPFRYGEEMTFSATGRPLLAYVQRTWSLDDGSAMHGERGYWRPQPDGRIEVVVAHTFGLVEVSEGSVRDGAVDVRSRALVSTSSAKTVDAVARAVEVRDGVLRYTLDMATAGRPLQHHLAAELARAG